MKTAGGIAALSARMRVKSVGAARRLSASRPHRPFGCNNRKKAFEVHTSTKTLVFPFSKADLVPTAKDPVAELFVDPEADREALTYALQSGRSGTVHIEQVLEYNRDPSYLRDSLLYRLTLEAQKRIGVRDRLARCVPCAGAAGHRGRSDERTARRMSHALSSLCCRICGRSGLTQAAQPSACFPCPG
jgi:hypothetical protein